jgi:putative NADH-flavin reductase
MKLQQDSPSYHILVIGGNGGIGRQCIQLALDAGHRVTAVLRTPSKLSFSHPNLNIVQGDITDPVSISPYFENKDAVISAVGVSGGLFSDKPTTLYSQAATIILAGMKNTPTKRAFFISASAIEISPVIPFFIRLIAKYVIQKLLKHMYADLRKMEALVKASDANWTIIRPPQLTDQPGTGVYRVAINAFLRNCLKISRADVAHFIIHHIGDEAIFHGTVEIGY